MTFYAPEYIVQFMRAGGFLDENKLLDHAERTGGVYSFRYNESFFHDHCLPMCGIKYALAVKCIAELITGWKSLSWHMRQRQLLELMRLHTAWPRRHT